ncbi:hypothetical protein PFISCL1PPCAC_7350, partial [Pristionchus fissidentatus]
IAYLCLSSSSMEPGKFRRQVLNNEDRCNDALEQIFKEHGDKDPEVIIGMVQGATKLSNDGLREMFKSSPQNGKYQDLYMLKIDRSIQTKEYPSKFINDFVSCKRIGEGASGCVFEASNVYDDWKYAVKRIKFMGKTESEFRRALREVRVMAKFDHPGIVRYYGMWIERPTQADVKRLCGREPEQHSNWQLRVVDDTMLIYIQIQLCKYSLKDWLERNQETRDLSIMKSWFKQMVCAVEHMHELQIMHRDLKPANILFTAPGTLKIADLGVATESGSVERMNPGHDNEEVHYGHTHTEKAGTPMYMCDEQKSWSYCIKVDVFTLGLIFTEMCHPMTKPVKEQVFENFRRGRSNEILNDLPEVSDFIRWLTKGAIATLPTCKEILNSPILAQV